MSQTSIDNNPVFSAITLKLGEIHWEILRASKEMSEKTTVKVETGSMGQLKAYRNKDTDFGREVGRDEINWWVFKKEPDVEELKEQTQRTLDALQILKSASEKLKIKPTSYEELLAALRSFAEDHEKQIEILRHYIQLLRTRDALAPAILFTYRVWGSTRMAERGLNFDVNAELDEETKKRLAEIVLGLTSNGLPTVFRAEYEIGADLADALADEPPDTVIRIPVEKVIRLAASLAVHELAEYLLCLRDSLRNILLDIEKFTAQRDLVNDDTFWRNFILKAVESKKTETQLWDFKETLPMWHAKSGPNKERAKVIFAEDVASFANADGGVLILGVTDQRDIVGVGNANEIEDRLKFSSDVLAKHLEYGRPICRLRQIVVTKNGSERVCVSVVIAQACEPVAVHDGQGHYTYPVRRETGLTRVPRSEIFDPKLHMKSDNYDFLDQLLQFVHDR